MTRAVDSVDHFFIGTSGYFVILKRPKTLMRPGMTLDFCCFTGGPAGAHRRGSEPPEIMEAKLQRGVHFGPSYHTYPQLREYLLLPSRIPARVWQFLDGCAIYIVLRILDCAADVADVCIRDTKLLNAACKVNGYAATSTFNVIGYGVEIYVVPADVREIHGGILLFSTNASTVGLGTSSTFSESGWEWGSL